MKRPESHYTDLEELISFSYGNFGNSLQIYTRPYFPGSPLGYCYRYSANGVTIYNVVTSPIGKPETDRRIKAHEFGHITLGHLQGIHEELDSRVLWAINNDRANLIEGINKSLGIDYADKLLSRVIDDPSLNHSLHNIAMDFEVNQQILSSEDIEEMEADITEAMRESDPRFKKIKEYFSKPDDELSEEEKAAKSEFNKQMSASKIKLMLPERYHFPDGSPFPTDLTYPEYLMLIIQNLGEFVKMLVSLKNGGSGDTSEVSEQDLQDALGDQDGQDQGQGQGQGGMQSIDDLLDACGMNGNSRDKYQGCQENPGDTQDGKNFDHATESRDEADDARKKGQIKSSPGTGCGTSGGVDSSIGPKDSVDMAIDEVIRGFKSKVISFELKKDMTYLYNRGINRQILAPVYHTKAKITSEPKIVFLIDVSGSMDRRLISRILNTISNKMKRIRRGLKYDIIAWNTRLCDHYENIDPSKPSPKLNVGGGTSMSRGIRFFKEHYDKSSVMVLISDFEDYLYEWEEETSKMSGYDLYGFCYGRSECTSKIKNFKIRNFKTQW